MEEEGIASLERSELGFGIWEGAVCTITLFGWLFVMYLYLTLVCKP